MSTRLSDNLLKLEHQAGFEKLSKWITAACHSKYSFALSAHQEVKTKPNDKDVFAQVYIE